MSSYFSDSHLLLQNCTRRVTGFSAVFNGFTLWCMHKANVSFQKIYIPIEERAIKNSKGRESEVSRGGGGGRGISKGKVLNESMNQN